jgi:preprotein translocase subunit YajC
VYLLLVFVVVLLIFSMWQSKKRKAQAAALHQAIGPGVRVMTTSGIYGIVTEVESDTMVIEISEGVDVRFAKQAVMRVVPHLDEAADDADTEVGGPAALDGVDGTADREDGDGVATPERARERVQAGSVEASRATGHEKGSDAVPTT